MIQRKAFNLYHKKNNKSFCFLLILILFLSTFLSDTVTSYKDVESPEIIHEDAYVPGELIIKFKDDVEINDLSSFDSLNIKHDITLIDDVFDNSEISRPMSNYYKLSFSEDKDLSALIKEYENLDFVEFVEPNYIYTLFKEPDDPRFLNGDLWGLYQPNGCHINAPAAWDIGTGNSNVVIAVVDTGVDYTHPDISGNYLKDEEGNPIGKDFINNDDDPRDDHGHGTHCAGTIGGVGDNTIGVTGVCWKVSIMAVKCLSSSGQGSAETVADSIEWAARNGADVISMSLGSSQPSSVVEDAVNFAYGEGVVLVAAAGNSASSAKHYPAAYDKVIAVAATDKNDKRASFSQYGSWIDVAAPGVDILSTIPGNKEYDTKSGTSMACPHVAGLAGLLLSKNPNLSNSEVRDILRSTTDTINPDHPIGTGRINAFKALKSISILECSPESHDFGEMHKDETNSTNLQITTSSTETISFSISEQVNWLTVTPNGGSCSETLPADITVDITCENLPYGINEGSIKIDAGEAGSAVFEVSVKIIGYSPDKPDDPYPPNDATGVELNPTLSIRVTDPDNDNMNVTFYNAKDNSKIHTQNRVPSGTTATAQWKNLENGQTYQWYATADDGFTNTTSETYTFTTNQPPTFSNIYPPDQAQDIPPGIEKISIEINDPDNDNYIWSITTDPDIGSSSGNSNTYSTQDCHISKMQPKTQYNWTVEATDEKGATIKETYSFTTKENTPPPPSNTVYPINNAQDISIICTLNWTCQDPDQDRLTYTLYFGTNQNPPSIIENTKDNQYTIPYDLELDNNYYWKVIAKDPLGETSESTLWSFKTSPDPPGPQPGSIDIGFNKTFFLSGNVRANLKNIGVRDASEVIWEINIKGGVRNRINITKSGNITRLDKDDSSKIHSHDFLEFKTKVFGFGKVNIMVKISNTDNEIVSIRSREAFAIGFSLILFN